MSQDWCDLCELPLSQCPHGAPPPPPPSPTPRSAPRPRKAPARAPSASATGPTSAPRRSSPAVTTRAPVRRTPPGRTPQTEFRKALLAELADQPVPVEREQVLAALEERMDLTEQDRGITADGEVRWRRTAIKERKAMADDGLVATAGHGMWVLSPAGREQAAEQAEAAPAAEAPDAAEADTD